MTLSARGGAALYTPDLLALAVSLGAMPYDTAMPLTGEARSRTCGSTLLISIEPDGDGRIARVGLRASACAVGQAAAALFARSASGLDRKAVLTARTAIADWLAGEAPLPDWAGFVLLEPARTYPARHGAILLAWDAALDALPNEDTPR